MEERLKSHKIIVQSQSMGKNQQVIKSISKNIKVFGKMKTGMTNVDSGTARLLDFNTEQINKHATRNHNYHQNLYISEH